MVDAEHSGVSVDLYGVNYAIWGFETKEDNYHVSWVWITNIVEEVFLISYDPNGTASMLPVEAKKGMGTDVPFAGTKDGKVIATVVDNDILVYSTDDGKTFSKEKMEIYQKDFDGKIVSLAVHQNSEGITIGIVHDFGDFGEISTKVTTVNNYNDDWEIVKSTEIQSLDAGFKTIMKFTWDVQFLVLMRSGITIQYWDIAANKIIEGFKIEKERNPLKLELFTSKTSSLCAVIEFGRLATPYYMVIDCTNNKVLKEGQAISHSTTTYQLLMPQCTASTVNVVHDWKKICSARDYSAKKTLATIDEENVHPCLAYGRLWTYIPSSEPKPPKTVPKTWDLVSVPY